MPNLDTFTLALIIGMALGALALTFFGVTNIRAGLRGAVQQQSALGWHRLPQVLLGINNIVFALLLVFLILLQFPVDQPALRYTLLALVLITFAVSIVLVVRAIMASISLATTLALQTQRSASSNNSPAQTPTAED